MGLHLHRKLIAYLIAMAMLVSVQTPAIFAEDMEVKSDSTSQSATEQSEKTEPTEAPEATEAKKTEPEEKEQPSGESDPPVGNEQQKDPQERSTETKPAGEAKENTSTNEDQSSIRIRLTLKKDEVTTWIDDMAVDVAPSSTVEYLLKHIVDEHEYGFAFSERGDLVTVTRPDSEGGESITAEDPESKGLWICEINDTQQQDPIRDRVLRDGDRLTIYFGSKDDGGEFADKTVAEGDVIPLETKANSGTMTIAQVPESNVINAYGNTKDRLTEIGDNANWTEDSVWIVVGLARSGELTQSQAQAYFNNLKNRLYKGSGNVLNANQSSDNSRAILALTAAGYDPTNVGGHNLLEPLADMNYVRKQGINGPVWALIAFDSNKYEIPQTGSGVQTTRDELIQSIVSTQKGNEGWTFSGNKSDVDMTCMVIQALAPYYKADHKITINGQEKSVKEAVDNALAWLSSTQNADGSFSSSGVTTSESASQVIVALTSLGIDPTKDPRFLKNGKGAVDSLMSFYVKGGGFKHVDSNYRSNTLATMQANYALVAYYRNRDNVNTLYDMSDAGSGYRIDGSYEKETPQSGDVSPPDTGGDSKKNDPKEIKKGKAKSPKAALPTAKGKTMGLTRSAGLIKLSGAKTKEAVRSIGLIEAVVRRDLPENARDYSEEDIKAIEDAYRAYMQLSPAEKLAVEKDKNWEPFSKIVAGLGKVYHFDEPTGIDMRANEEAALPWHVRLVIKEVELSSSQKKSIDDALQGNGKITDTYDIHFIDTLDDKKWKPEKIINVDMPITAVTNKDPLTVHITDKGKIEFIRGTVVRSEEGTKTYSEKILRFKATDFSIYGMVTDVGSIDRLMDRQEEEKKLPLLWICISAGALIALAALVIARRRLVGHEE